jgi:hypothetical protein
MREHFKSTYGWPSEKCRVWGSRPDVLIFSIKLIWWASFSLGLFCRDWFNVSKRAVFQDDARHYPHSWILLFISPANRFVGAIQNRLTGNEFAGLRSPQRKFNASSADCVSVIWNWSRTCDHIVISFNFPADTWLTKSDHCKFSQGHDSRNINL